MLLGWAIGNNPSLFCTTFEGPAHFLCAALHRAVQRNRAKAVRGEFYHTDFAFTPDRTDVLAIGRYFHPARVAQTNANLAGAVDRGRFIGFKKLGEGPLAVHVYRDPGRFDRS